MNILNKIFFKIKSIRSLTNLASVSKTLIYRHILGKEIEWNIAYVRKNWKVAFNKNKIFTIPNSKRRWNADPFVIKKNKLHYIFFEDYSIKNNKGSISCVAVNKKNKTKHYKEIIKENFHLSFPFIFKYNKKYFMIPEARESQSIKLYKCTKFPNKWKFFKNIMTNIDYVDPVIFKWKKSWILILSKTKNNFLYSKLYIYISKNPLSSNWKPLKSNPVIQSNIFGRNGGFIQESNKKIYRVSQAYLPGNYGAYISINEIFYIFKNNYKEKTIHKILPPNKKEIKGIHTLNYVKNFTVFDYSKWVK
jgi:hypothetical protein